MNRVRSQLFWMFKEPAGSLSVSGLGLSIDRITIATEKDTAEVYLLLTLSSDDTFIECLMMLA